jgi:hypothetical protein
MSQIISIIMMSKMTKQEYDLKRREMDDLFFTSLQDNKTRFDIEVRAITEKYFVDRKALDAKLDEKV